MSSDKADSSVSSGAGALFVVATPIGNLQDLSPRAAAVLRDAQILLAEDTRHTQQLLYASSIARNGGIESLHEHNERSRVEDLVARLGSGARMALVSDAGTPLLSDPGAVLVAAAARAGIEVIAIPGPCAPIAALSISGLSAERFAFEGFLPARAAARRRSLAALVAEVRTLIFLEAPHRLAECLEDLEQAFGGAREAVIAREITKKFETVYRGTLAQLRARLAVDTDMARGEIVLLVAGAAPVADDPAQTANAGAVLRALLSELPVSQAVRLAARITGRGRNDLYARALEINATADKDA